MLTKPDKGWAWVVVLATFGASIVQGGFMYAIGFLHIAFLERFQESVTKTSWAGSLFLCFNSITSPVSGFVIDRFSCRVTMIAGSVIMCVGLLSSAFLPSLEWILLSFGVITGMGSSLCYISTMVVVGLNFEKKRNLAYGISVSGIGVGATAFAPLIEITRDTYGNAGLFFICSGLALQLCLFGALFFPSQIESKRKREMLLKTHDKTEHYSVRSKVMTYLGNFKNYSLLIFSLGMLFGQLGIYSVFIHFPEYIVSTGKTALYSSYLLSLSGVCGTIARLLSGLSANADNIDETVIYVGCMGLLGLNAVLLPLYSHSRIGQVVFALFHGTYFGATVPMLGSILTKIAGIENLSTSFGQIFFAAGIGIFIGPPLAGFIVDSGGTYETSLSLAGFCMLLGAILGAASVSFTPKRISQEIKEEQQTLNESPT